MNQQQARERFQTLLDWIALETRDIDAATPADPQWPDEPPEWWHAMQVLRQGAAAMKARHFANASPPISTPPASGDVE
jgi:hypothetical protein